MSLRYSLVRFVPDPARGEFINIGAVVGDEEAGEWDARIISNHKRAKGIDLGGRWSAALTFVGELDDRLAAGDEFPGTERATPLTLAELERMAAEMNNLVQLTAPAPVVAANADEALDLIFDQLIVDPARASFRFAKKNQAQASTRAAYRRHDLPAGTVRERAAVTSGVFDERFDFVVHNGRAVQLVQCWSFQLPNQEELAAQVKSWSWVVHELRKQGGVLEAGQTSVEVPADLDVFAVAIEPEPGADAPAYEEARAAFEENDVRELGLSQAEQVGARAAQLLAGST